MTKPQTIHLGYEVGTGDTVSIPVSHLCVTGQTQLSGKTTTLEALISRSGLKAVAFVTKRGEGAFNLNPIVDRPLANSLSPFFRHKADWQFVSEILGAVLNEKLKFERSWIMKASKGAKTLHDVERNVNEWLAKPKLRSLDESVLTTMSEYFKLFMPELESLPFTPSLDLRPGLNVMDLSSYSTPLQMLVISAVVEEVYKHQKDVVTLIPEAWEVCPQGKSSPAKAACVALIRKGGGLRNFVWVDSQDLAGVEKVIVKAAGVYLLGVQREQNEVKRTLEHVPRSFKLKVDDIMTLSKGQFWACFGEVARKVYVQPAWMSEDLAKVVALGGCSELPSLPSTYNRIPSGIPYEVDNSYSHDRTTQAVVQEIDMDAQERQAFQERAVKDEAEIRRLTQQVEELSARLNTGVERVRVTVPKPAGVFDVSSVVAAILNSPPTLSQFACALKPHFPSNGVVQHVEPREVVLKRFQQAEVERILAEAAVLSPFARQLIAFLEARDTGVKKSKAVTAVTGKNFINMARDCSGEYETIRELASGGWIREDTKNSLIYPNLGVGIKRRVAEFEATNEDVDGIIGQVMLTLKG